MQKEAWSKDDLKSTTIDTELDSPYDIYKNMTMPTVDNPGVSAIEAAVNQIRPMRILSQMSKMVKFLR